MNGAHDLGGQMGFGPIDPEADEPIFHADWERRALSLTLCAGAMGHWTLDESRHARESLRPADYLSSSYYEIWIKGLEVLLQRHGVVTADELRAAKPLVGAPPAKRKLMAADVPAVLARGGPTTRDKTGQPKFKTGDRVRTIIIHPTGHTRLPRYARGKVGTIEQQHGAHVFPDTNAHGRGEQPDWLYTVAFDGRELWGREGDPQTIISVDAWEAYLEPV